MTKEKILAKLDNMEQQKVTLLARIGALDVATLTAKESADKWSVLDVIEHMVLVEEHVFQGWPELDQFHKL